TTGAEALGIPAGTIGKEALLKMR
ncbi:DUF1805 domain-containing protein, partial [Bacillus sp. HC-Mk]